MGPSEEQIKLPVLIQPNAVTSARYEYSQMQKDFMYHFIEKMGKFMSRDRIPKDLFGNTVIEMDLKDICKGGNYTQMLDAIKDLQKKPISYNYNRGDGIYDVTTTLIATIQHKRGTGKLFLTTTEASLPVISYIGAGYTALNKSIALSLQSSYAKRMYEICCRWKDRGFYRVTLKEFRKMMMVEDKFLQTSDLRKNVLDVSEKMLSKDADLTFTYELRKENGSKSANWLELNIIPTSGEDEKKSSWYSMLYNIIYQIYRDATAMLVCNFIEERGTLKKAAERFRRLQKDIDTGRIQPHGILQYVNKVLEREFEVPETMTTSRAMQEKKKKKVKATYVKVAAESVKKAAAEKREMERNKRDAKEIIQGMISGDKKEEPDEGKRTGKTLRLRDLFGKKG
jgi:plasmid replication initiation protein